MSIKADLEIIRDGQDSKFQEEKSYLHIIVADIAFNIEVPTVTHHCAG